MQASVIIPTYAHRSLYLRDSLMAILEQTVPAEDYEVLVVDNSLSSQARGIVDQINAEHAGHTVRYFHEPVTGLHNARHLGAREARGEIIVYGEDDVIVHSQWLEAILYPFRDSRVGCVGGKVVPKWEAEPPPWVAQFDIAYLSLLDFGDQTRELRFPECVWGCNMAVRREVLYSVGGFNPDGFGDRQLIWLRGDGECGLQEKISNRELRIIYEPRAWVYHRIPASRVTPQYFYRRLFDDGIMHSYVRIRKMGNCHFLTLQLLGYGIYCLLQSCQKYLRSITASRYQVRLRADAWGWYGRCLHQLRTAGSSDLRQHILRQSYL